MYRQTPPDNVNVCYHPDLRCDGHSSLYTEITTIRRSPPPFDFGSDLSQTHQFLSLITKHCLQDECHHQAVSSLSVQSPPCLPGD